jgi:hypothetical protein
MTGATVGHQEIFIEPKVLLIADLSENNWCHDWCHKPGPIRMPTLGTVESRVALKSVDKTMVLKKG